MEQCKFKLDIHDDSASIADQYPFSHATTCFKIFASRRSEVVVDMEGALASAVDSK